LKSRELTPTRRAHTACFQSWLFLRTFARICSQSFMADKRVFRWLRWVLVLVVLIAGAAFGGWYLSHSHNGVPQYQTAVITVGDLTQAVTATGTLNPVVNIQVGSQISGMIEKLLVDYNSQVKTGQVIAELDAATYRAQVHQAEGDLANARAGLELAQVNAVRAKELRTNDLISPSDLDKAMGDLHQAEAQVTIKDAALEKAKVDLSRCTIYAPVDGIIISRNVDVGQTVAASLSAPTIFVIANDLSKMQIDANVAEADVGGIEAGQPVDFTVDAFPSRTFHGKVVQVRNAPITVQNVVTYDTVIEVSNPDLKLKPGMTANVSIIIAQREEVLKIPNAALRFRPPEVIEKANVSASASRRPGGQRGPMAGGGGGSGGRPRGERQPTRTVYTLSTTNDLTGNGETKPQPAQIKTGISDGINTEMIEGLAEGVQVVTGINTPQASAPRPNNPFSGGQRRF
jgi:HlyD family secretion protein